MFRITQFRAMWLPTLRAVRDGWVALGIALLMLLGLEWAYRAQAWLRRMVRGTAADAAFVVDRTHPYADSAWYPTFLRERDGMQFAWEPFKYSRVVPQAGRYVNIDSSGLRVVPQRREHGDHPLRVFFFGGSTTWGWYDRDSATRPAVVARRLADAGIDAEVVNYAQTGFVSAQGLLALMLELRRGNVPDAVVFWDGVNDIMSARANGRPGVSMREFQQDSDAASNARHRRTGSVGDAEAVRALMRHSALLGRLLDVTRRPLVTAPVPDPVPFCRGVMQNWVGEARIVDALAQDYGFRAWVIWQPQWQTSGRPRSAFERKIATQETEYASGEVGLTPSIRECARVADSLVSHRAAKSIMNWATMHSDDTATVFLDQYSHTSERATAIEGDSVAKLLISTFDVRRHSSSHGR